MGRAPQDFATVDRIVRFAHVMQEAGHPGRVDRDGPLKFSEIPAGVE